MCHERLVAALEMGLGGASEIPERDLTPELRSDRRDVADVAVPGMSPRSAPLDLLGWRLQRHRKRRSPKHYIYPYPQEALQGIKEMAKTLRRQTPAPDAPNPFLNGERVERRTWLRIRAQSYARARSGF